MVVENKVDNANQIPVMKEMFNNHKHHFNDQRKICLRSLGEKFCIERWLKRKWNSENPTANDFDEKEKE